MPGEVASRRVAGMRLASSSSQRSRTPSRDALRRPMRLRRPVVAASVPAGSRGSATARARSGAAAPPDGRPCRRLVHLSLRSGALRWRLLRERASSTFAGPPPRPARRVPRASRRLPSSCSPSSGGRRSAARACEWSAACSIRSLGTAQPCRAIDLALGGRLAARQARDVPAGDVPHLAFCGGDAGGAARSSRPPSRAVPRRAGRCRRPGRR
jgi:hypothetical protein